MEHLKSEASLRLTQRHSGRGWHQLFDILNEARAYNYLKRTGCTRVRFIRRSHRRTPDLEGSCTLGRSLCEVKTINISDEEVAARIGPPKARSLPINLTPGFLNKLRTTIETAKQQMAAYDSQGTAVHLVYLNILFDDFFAELKEEYYQQIDQYLTDQPVTGIQLVICNEQTAFYKPLRMHSAHVDNIG